MKKTALALLAAALVANSASALTILDSKETGTKIDFIGSARLKWTSTSDKNSSVNGLATRNHVNDAVRNNGSRFGFRINQQLGNDFYVLGRVEWRMRGTSSSKHDFDDVYTRQLYAGIGHRQYGELTYGNMTTITDEVKQTDLPNTLSLSDGLLAFAARRAVQYTYKGIEGLKLGAFYGNSSPRGNEGLSLSNKRKDIWGAAAIYNYDINQDEKVTFATGITRERYNQSGLSAYERLALAVGTAYTLGKTTVGLDIENRTTKDQGTIGNERKEFEVRSVLYHRLTDDWRAYTMYAYKQNKLDTVAAADTKAKKHQFMLGTEYYIVPKTLKTFVEWQATRTKNYADGEKSSKQRNYTTVIGVRLYW